MSRGFKAVGLATCLVSCTVSAESATAHSAAPIATESIPDRLTSTHGRSGSSLILSSSEIALGVTSPASRLDPTAIAIEYAQPPSLPVHPSISTEPTELPRDLPVAEDDPSLDTPNPSQRKREPLIRIVPVPAASPTATSPTVVAQVPPQILPPTEPLPELPSPDPLPPATDLLRPSPQALPENLPRDSFTGTFVVKRFQVVGSTVFDQAVWDQVTAPFTNRPITFSELIQARSAVTQYYLDRGYATTGAIVPPQTVKSGVVVIQVVEGGLEEIRITGTNRLKPHFIRSRIALAANRPVNTRRLVEALQLLQQHPLIQEISADLAAGSRPGVNLLEVKVKERRSTSLQVTMDNKRSPSVGSVRREVQATEASLLGLGDSISLTYVNSKGSNSFGVDYTIPFNPRDGTISVSFITATSRIIEDPFDQIDIEAASRDFSVTLRQPAIRTPTQELAFGLTGTMRQGNTSILGFPFPLSAGASDFGETKVTALRFFQEWTQRDSQQIFAMRSQFSFGLNALGATINPQPPDSQFFTWRGQAQWVRLLAPDTLFLLRTDIQVADRTLLPLEQFGLGGMESVRGYRQDVFLADNGVQASAELRIPIYRDTKTPITLQVAPFFDIGRVWNSAGGPTRNTLVGMGVGLRLRVSDRLTARLDWGIPLITLPSNPVGGGTWQENGVYFSLVFNPL